MRLPNPKCVVKVGAGRGFVMEPRGSFGRRVIVTAAHCLPKLPPACTASYTEERTYRNLVGSFDGPKGNVCAECLFVDPVADIAVLD